MAWNVERGYQAMALPSVLEEPCSRGPAGEELGAVGKLCELGLDPAAEVYAGGVRIEATAGEGAALAVVSPVVEDVAEAGARLAR